MKRENQMSRTWECKSKPQCDWKLRNSFGMRILPGGVPTLLLEGVRIVTEKPLLFRIGPVALILWMGRLDKSLVAKMFRSLRSLDAGGSFPAKVGRSFDKSIAAASSQLLLAFSPSGENFLATSALLLFTWTIFLRFFMIFRPAENSRGGAASRKEINKMSYFASTVGHTEYAQNRWKTRI